MVSYFHMIHKQRKHCSIKNSCTLSIAQDLAASTLLLVATYVYHFRYALLRFIAD